LRIVDCADHLTVPASALAFVSFGEDDGADARCTHRWLAPAEAAYARRLATTKRRAAWLAGRLAAKDAIRRLATTSTPLDRIEVLPTATGAPIVRGKLPTSGGPLDVSISHTRNVAAAIAFERRRSGAMGIDVEVCDQEIDPALVDFAFSGDEAGAIRALADASERHLRILQFWTAKEAALKAVGRGLRLPLSAVRLVWTDGVAPHCASVESAPDLRIQFELRSIRYSSHVVSVAIEIAHAS
jgi:4'-phosphopantetheinyl transferase